MNEESKEPKLATPITAAYDDSEGMELLLRAIVDQWERKEEFDGELPSYFVESIVVEYMEGIESEKVKIDWSRSCILIHAPILPNESKQARKRRDLEYQTNYLPICGGIKEQQALQLGIMLDDCARERVIGKFLERHKKSDKSPI